MSSQRGSERVAARDHGIARSSMCDAIFAKWHIGGHPLKHVTGALAALMILLWLMKRHDSKSH